jgi:hypothetical protein
MSNIASLQSQPVHRLGQSLEGETGQPPKFAQIYFLETAAQQIQSRLQQYKEGDINEEMLTELQVCCFFIDRMSHQCRTNVAPMSKQLRSIFARMSQQCRTKQLILSPNKLFPGYDPRKSCVRQSLQKGLATGA